MEIQAEELKRRTKQFAVRIIKIFRSLPKSEEARIIGKQVLRSGTSIAANYRAVCRARSKAEFIAKIGIVVEEALVFHRFQLAGNGKVLDPPGDFALVQIRFNGRGGVRPDARAPKAVGDVFYGNFRSGTKIQMLWSNA